MRPEARGRPRGHRNFVMLNAPRPIGVRTDRAGRPRTVWSPSGWRQVQRVLDEWRVDEDWWSHREIRRTYYRVEFEGPVFMTVFQDLITREWFKQHY